MKLILNTGSSSFKYRLYEENLSEVSSDKLSVSRGNYRSVFLKIINSLGQYHNKITKIGHRVVHGGDEADEVMEIDINVIKLIEKYADLAPLHNPPAIEIIRIAIEKIPQAKQYAIFDTAFFKNLPEETKIYPLESKISEEFFIKRFGFHGLSHQAMLERFDPEKKKKIITVHLGSGSSIAAIKNGEPLDTSMGFTPLEGLPMQTRSGDIDPGIILMLAEKIGIKKTRSIIEDHSGLAGISGTDGDMLKILSSDNEKSKLALSIFCYRVQKYIGSYIAALGGIDLLIFSGEIGYGSDLIRKKITRNIDFINFDIKTLEPNEELSIAKKLSDVRNF